MRAVRTVTPFKGATSVPTIDSRKTAAKSAVHDISIGENCALGRMSACMRAQV